jgi:hypothetical protein
MSQTFTSDKLKNIDATNTKTLNTISELQQLEKQLYVDLEAAATDTSPQGRLKQQQIIKRINSLSETRINLFGTLKDLYQSTQNSVASSRKQLVDKMVVAKMMEEQLNNLKKNMEVIKGAKDNKLRMVEINTYYGKRYQAHTDLMKLIIIVCIPLLILSVLNKKALIPENVFSISTAIILAVGGFFILRKILDLSMRSNMNYDEYDWKRSPTTSGNSISEYNRKHLGLDDLTSKIGSSLTLPDWSVCGEGTKFDTEKNQCLVDENYQPVTDITTAKEKGKVESFCPMGFLGCEQGDMMRRRRRDGSCLYEGIEGYSDGNNFDTF